MPRVLMGAVVRALSNIGVQAGDRLVVAVSGGVDSMVLLHVLACLVPRLDVRLHVAHIHHGLRGRSADQDAALVSAEAARYGLPVSVERLAADTRPAGTSVQVWAREARYARLEALRRRLRAAWILTAHTQNDQAETVLLNLLRGTGPRGLAGIPSVRERILRPLLTVPRVQIEAYAAARGVAFREDPSNRSLAYRRNRIRLHLLPILARDYNPQVVATLAALAAQAREDEEALSAQAEMLAARAIQRRGKTVAMDVSRVRTAPPALARRLFQEAFRQACAGRHGLMRRHVAALMRLTVHGGRVALPGGLQAWVSAQMLWLGRTSVIGIEEVRSGGAGELAVEPGRWMRWEPGQCAVRIRRVAKEGVTVGLRGPQRELLSPRLLQEPLSLREWRPGDRFQPLGLPGTKKLQDFFVDAKVPRLERRRVPVLLAGDRIAWVVGHRISDAFRWKGERVACLAEVRSLEGRHGVSARSHTAVGR